MNRTNRTRSSRKRQAPAIAPVMSQLELARLGGGQIAYIRVLSSDEAQRLYPAVEGSGTPGAVYEAGGPEIFSFRQLLDKTQEWTGRRRFYLHIPFWTANLMAALTWPLPNSIRPFTLDQVRLLKRDNVVSAAAEQEGRNLQGLGVSRLHTAESIVPVYLEHFRPRGQFARYRG